VAEMVGAIAVGDGRWINEARRGEGKGRMRDREKSVERMRRDVEGGEEARRVEERTEGSERWKNCNGE